MLTTVEEEQITSSAFHPSKEDTLLYTTDSGKINILDLRQASSFNKTASVSFEISENNTRGNSVHNKQLNVIS